MLRKPVSIIALSLLVISTLTLAFNLQPVKAEGTIYIRADGSVDPPTAPIQRDRDLYTLTDNINGSIVIERDNIVVDGAGYTVQGVGGATTGIYLYERVNVTIKNTGVKACLHGIIVIDSSNITVFRNNIANNAWGLILECSSNNMLKSNSMVNNTYNFEVRASIPSHFVNDVDVSNTVDGKPIYYWINKQEMAVPLDAGCVVLVNCVRITVQDLNLTNNGAGVLLAWTENSTITKNTVTNNQRGIILGESSNNMVSGNNIINNYFGIGLGVSSNNTVSDNNITNRYYGIILDSSSNTTVSGNKVYGKNAKDYEGIILLNSSNNQVSGNNIINNYDGLILFYSSNNTVSVNNVNSCDIALYLRNSSKNIVYHNNFINNSQQVNDMSWDDPQYPVSINVWDDGYPSGGNYWCDYTGVDLKSGPNQDQPGSDGMGDTPYVIDADNRDRYPLTTPWGPVSEYPLAKWIESPNYTPLGWRNITYIVIHVMDGYFEGTIEEFKNNASGKSAHYLVSQEGEIVQMVREKDIAWHAGNWSYNERSIGIEHEDQRNWNKPNWATEELYQSSAALVRYLCAKYGIPKDRAHLIGHNEVPRVTKPCPGPYWDWDYFMGLVKGIPTPRTFYAVWENIDYPVSISSNSTVSNFTFNQPQAQISFNVTGTSGTRAFCNITIPNDLLKGPWTFIIEPTPTAIDISEAENATYNFLYFTYTHESTFQITIQGAWVIPEFPSIMILPLFIIATLIAAILSKKKRNPKSQPLFCH